AAPLAQVADLSRLWVRVAVPESDLPRINARKPVTIDLGPSAGRAPLGRYLFDATPIALVPQADPIRHTADLLYELIPASGEQRLMQAWSAVASSAWNAATPRAVTTPFARDQMLTVPVPLGERRRECTVPVSAVIYDAYGSAWIYILQKTDATTQTYER